MNVGNMVVSNMRSYRRIVRKKRGNKRGDIKVKSKNVNVKK